MIVKLAVHDVASLMIHRLTRFSHLFPWVVGPTPIGENFEES